MTSFPLPRTCPMTPPSGYAELRADHPICRVTMPDGQPAWLVTGYSLARELLADGRMSADGTHPAFPLIVAGVGRDQLARMRDSMVGKDGAAHSRLRRSVIAEFSVRRIRRMRPRVQRIVDELVDGLLAAVSHPVDLVDFAVAVPSRVICELLGVPPTERQLFAGYTDRVLNRHRTAEERFGALNWVEAYLDDLITTKEKSPGDDLLSRLVGSLTHREMVVMARLLLVAGHETTANMIPLSVAALLDNPDQLATLQAEPSLMPRAVDELLRYFSIVDAIIARVATADIPAHGISAGEGIVIASLAANWDADAFPDPARLDIRRRAKHHVAFGFGPHQCLGQHLARLELAIVLETLFRRIPGLRLVKPVASLPYKRLSAIHGVTELFVTW